jgi:hypothetical protein
MKSFGHGGRGSADERFFAGMDLRWLTDQDVLIYRQDLWWHTGL